MAASSRELHLSRKWHAGVRDTSPERKVVWTEPKTRNSRATGGRNSVGGKKVVPVVYYISRNGHLEHPHFVEVSLPRSAVGLLLKDVMNRLNQLRGRGMASLHSWSAKRSYKNGFVWHDLSEEDLVPSSSSQREEYVLKGTLLFPPDSVSAVLPVRHDAAVSSSFRYCDDPPAMPLPARRRNQSCSSLDINGLNEFKVCKTVDSESPEFTETIAADAAAQKEESKVRRRQAVPEVVAEAEEKKPSERREDEIEEVTPPPSDSSPETLEFLLKADGPLVLPTTRCGEGNEDDTAAADEGCGRTTKASAILMQLISCGSLSFRDCGAAPVQDQGLTFIGSQRSLFGGATPKDSGSFSRASLEEKEYFSGSLVEIKKRRDGGGGGDGDGDIDCVGPVLKRSNSFNADR